MRRMWNDKDKGGSAGHFDHNSPPVKGRLWEKGFRQPLPAAISDPLVVGRRLAGDALLRVRQGTKKRFFSDGG